MCNVCAQVCGSDGITYADQCQLRTIACRQDMKINVEHLGQCKGEISLKLILYLEIFALIHSYENVLKV